MERVKKMKGANWKELNASPRLRELIKENDRYGYSAERAVLMARFYHLCGIDASCDGWDGELVSIMDDAGYIRHDLDLKSRCVDAIRLYACLCHPPQYTLCHSTLVGELYENYAFMLEEQIATIKQSIEEILDEIEARVIELIYGTEPHDIPMIARLLSLSEKQVTDIHYRSMSKLAFAYAKGKMPRDVFGEYVIPDMESIKKMKTTYLIPMGIGWEGWTDLLPNISIGDVLDHQTYLKNYHEWKSDKSAVSIERVMKDIGFTDFAILS